VPEISAPTRRGVLFHILDVVFNIVVIVAIVGGVRTFLVSPFQVEGHSMDSTLADGEYIVINKLAYWIGTPQRGDVVVLRPPTMPDRYYVKRVIGVPGDTIIIADGQVRVRQAGEEVALQEPYLDERNQGKTFPCLGRGTPDQPLTYEVPEGRYVVLGDNRTNSTDSRCFSDGQGQPSPFVSVEDVKGKVWVVALPISKIQALEAPQYEGL
jgi:signal peptidase I